MLGVLALHAFLRGRIRGLSAAVLLGSLPVAILATMTRAVWLSFAVSVMVLILSRTIGGCGLSLRWGGDRGALGLLVALSFDDQRRALNRAAQGIRAA